MRISPDHLAVWQRISLDNHLMAGEEVASEMDRDRKDTARSCR